MHIRESQNVIVARALGEAALRLPVVQKISQSAAGTSPTPPRSDANVLRAGVQLLGEAVLGQ